MANAPEKTMEEPASTNMSHLRNHPLRKTPNLVEKKAEKSGGGVFGTVVGGTVTLAGAGVLAAGILATGTLSIAIGAGMILLGSPIGISGIRSVTRSGRFRSYCEVIGEKTRVEIAELAEYIGKSPEYVCDDLRKMISDKMFREARFSQDGKLLLVSSEAYADYRKEQELIDVKNKADAELEKTLREKGLTTEGIKIIYEGRNYAERFTELSSVISDTEMKEKAKDLADILRRILSELENRPDKSLDLRRLINYYLPTTEKLLNSYQEIDEEPVKTDAMLETKEEIRRQMDSVNGSLKQLLDKIFRNQAWDVSSDISVMNTMFHQDGLKGNDFQRSEKKEERE